MCVEGVAVVVLVDVRRVGRRRRVVGSLEPILEGILGFCLGGWVVWKLAEGGEEGDWVAMAVGCYRRGVPACWELGMRYGGLEFRNFGRAVCRIGLRRVLLAYR